MSPSLNPALSVGPPADEGQRAELIEILCQGIRGLAALYSGRASPEDLRLSGLAQGSAQGWAAAAPVFAGPAPVMPDMF